MDIYNILSFFIWATFGGIATGFIWSVLFDWINIK